MDDKLSKIQLKNILSDIILGFSIVQDFFISNDIVYIKHFTNIDSSSINNKKEFFLNKAKNQGILTRDEKIEYLKEEKLWPESNEKKILELKNFVETLNATKLKLWREIEANDISKQIKETYKQIEDLEYERDTLIEYTAESYAYKKINELFVKFSLYKDIDYKIRYFQDNDFNDLEDEQVNNLIRKYNEKMDIFNNLNLRKIGLLDDFYGLFSLCNDNPYYLFGKPILLLSHYQIQIFQYSKNFKYILTNSSTNPPPDVMEDPDKLESWFNLSKNTEKLLDNPETNDMVATMPMGASKEDLKRMGADKPGLDISTLAGKSFEEIIKAHGI